MQNPENGFSPLLIDRQIEHSATLLPREEAQLIHSLQAMYDQDNSDTVNRVWARLRPEKGTFVQREQSPTNVSPLKFRDANPPREHEPRQATAFVRRLNLLAALLIVALLVGGLTFVLALTRGHTASTGSHSGPASGWGHVVYEQTMADFGFNGLAWSPDSKRVAASNRASQTNVVRIWDAATGQHLITIPVHTFVITVAWSPDSQQVAIATNQSVIIADGQSGHIIRTLTAASLFSMSTSSGGGFLSSRLPASGGPAIRDLAWSPDGKQIAAAAFTGSLASSVTVWNLQSGAPFYLPVKESAGIERISWSSDGAYIAADAWSVGSANPLSELKVVVWKIATRKLVLQKDVGSLPDINPVIAWQPGTHNLAQIGAVKVGSSYATAILVFDGLTGKKLKTLVTPASDVLSWSPDGKYLAYISPADVVKGNTAYILNASNWSTVYTYKNSTNIINELAWSPNGHSIATGETVIDGDTSSGVVRVWDTLDQV